MWHELCCMIVDLGHQIDESIKAYEKECLRTAQAKESFMTKNDIRNLHPENEKAHNIIDIVRDQEHLSKSQTKALNELLEKCN